MTLNDRIQQRLKKLQKTERRVSLEAGLSDSFLRNIRSGKSLYPRVDTLEKVALVLKTNVNWLIYGKGEEEQTITAVCLDIDFQRKIPLYGQAVAGFYDEFQINQGEAQDIWCPAPLLSQPDAYAVIIAGNTMEPRYQEGEYAFIDPSKPIKKGDYVLAKIKANSQQVGSNVYIKRFVSHNYIELVLEQFSPHKRLYFCHKDVLAIHYIAFSGSF